MKEGRVSQPPCREVLQRVYTRVRDVSCDSVVLGCTEVPAIMSHTNSPRAGVGEKRR